MRQTFRQSQISSTKQPAAPTHLQVLRLKAGENFLAWDFTPDLENGIPAFRIYRNGWLIGTLRGQQHNFGDAPEPSNIALEFHDAQGTSSSVYQVAAVNALGESISPSAQP